MKGENVFMKKTRTFLWIITLLTMILALSGCNNASKQSRDDMEVYYGNKKIGFYGDDISFTEILKEEDINNLIYVANNEEITITFNDKKPQKMKITEHILNTKGEYKYKDGEEGKEIDVTTKGNDFVFQITPNVSTMLSSNGEDYNAGEVIKGYHISIEDGEKNFYFVIKGDAAVLNENAAKLGAGKSTTYVDIKRL